MNESMTCVCVCVCVTDAGSDGQRRSELSQVSDGISAQTDPSNRYKHTHILSHAVKAVH